MKILYGILISIMALSLSGCNVEAQKNSDKAQQIEQERILKEANAQTGLPNIKNFRERKLLKDIIEMRDQEGLITYTYFYSEMQGKLVFFCDSIGYPMSSSTQYTNPQKIQTEQIDKGYAILPQADPNGLFSPSSAEGSWVMCKEPGKDKVSPVYSEPRLVTSTFKLPQ